MDIASLHAFLAVAETGSFSTAAERLFLTQPAVSKRVASLEQQLQQRLFDRLGHQIMLTEAGRTLLPYAINITQTLKDSQQAIADLSDSVSGRLNMATSHHIGLHRLPSILKQFNTDYPAVDLDIQFLSSELAFEQVANGRLDLAVTTLPSHYSDQLNVTHLWTDDLEIICSVNHPLAQQKPFCLEALASYPAILPTQDTFTRQLINQAIEPIIGVINVSLQSNYLETVKMLVSVGLGWSVLPGIMLDKKCYVLRDSRFQLQRQLGCINHQNRTLSSAAREFISRLSHHKKRQPKLP
ncbi:MAG: LysR family transcriptional regulator [Gammaproteobacteria bacterium]|nr:LysR family transcriptional regulator [Gammaproteobacteria bacterium]MDH5728699.1 LysR family transcriptional regulator [Gammaproteobacteria bacterium]